VIPHARGRAALENAFRCRVDHGGFLEEQPAIVAQFSHRGLDLRQYGGARNAQH